MDICHPKKMLRNPIAESDLVNLVKTIPCYSMNQVSPVGLSFRTRTS